MKAVEFLRAVQSMGLPFLLKRMCGLKQHEPKDDFKRKNTVGDFTSLRVTLNFSFMRKQKEKESQCSNLHSIALNLLLAHFLFSISH